MDKRRTTVLLRVQVCILLLCFTPLSHHIPHPALSNNRITSTGTISDFIAPRLNDVGIPNPHRPPTPISTTHQPLSTQSFRSSFPILADAMAVDSSSAGPSTEGPKRISTHGPRGSRREQWRLSKGLPARPQAKGMNRQGGISARRKAGRSHRRR